MKKNREKDENGSRELLLGMTVNFERVAQSERLVGSFKELKKLISSSPSQTARLLNDMSCTVKSMV